MTNHIDHFAEARKHISWMEELLEAGEGSSDAVLLASGLIAQAEATLALAEQKRLSNLVGLLKDTFASHQAFETLSDIATAQSGQIVRLRPEISIALGIEIGENNE